MSVRSAIVAASLTLLTTSCGGEIEFGAPFDAGVVVVDTGVAPIDSGTPEPDAGDTTPDTGVPPDAGCVKTYAATWPWARDKATYQDKFWTWSNTQQGLKCNSAGCHGGGVSPLIPATDNDLNITPTLNQAIDELWSAIVPALQPNGATTALLGYAHKPAAQGGGGEAPPYSAAQQQFLDALVDSAGTCP
ncbi:hypothetical protein L6R52_27380 [Myxococcota bacterium]|nr:hypothetical protein [Myxococcota bacterium]